MILEAILQEVRKTNPDITLEKLYAELYKSYYSTVAICIKVFPNKTRGD